uniref:Uncharacterized protein n=1 Tax=Sciurus vulgaris TaxID=55149 RepID=A0A8D2D1Y8_SCIVU
SAPGRRSPWASWKFNLDLACPVEDGIFYSGNFERFLREKVKVKGKIQNLRNVVHIECLKNKSTVKYLFFFFFFFLQCWGLNPGPNNLRDGFHVLASDKETYELHYFQISQDEDESETNCSPFLRFYFLIKQMNYK